MKLPITFEGDEPAEAKPSRAARLAMFAACAAIVITIALAFGPGGLFFTH